MARLYCRVLHVPDVCSALVSAGRRAATVAAWAGFFFTEVLTEGRMPAAKKKRRAAKAAPRRRAGAKPRVRSDGEWLKQC